jgi:voltage-gated potassium channel
MRALGSVRHLKIAVLFVLGVLLLGTVGYMLIEQLSFVDALYTTINMMATVGNVVHPLSGPGRLFSMLVIVVGVGSLLYTLGAGMEFMIEGHFSQAVRKRFMEHKIAALRQHYIVCGFGRVGSQIAEDVAAAGLPFVVIDTKDGNVQTCIQRDYLALQGDATSDDVLQEAGIRQAKGLLVATDEDAHNISITLSARHLNSKLFIVARANHKETEAKLKLAGADRVHSPYTMSGHRMTQVALQPGVVDFFDVLTKEERTELAIEELDLAAASPLVGITFVDAQKTMRHGMMIVAVKKAGRIIPGASAHVSLAAGDTVIVVGSSEQLAAFQQEQQRWVHQRESSR